MKVDYYAGTMPSHLTPSGFVEKSLGVRGESPYRLNGIPSSYDPLGYGLGDANPPGIGSPSKSFADKAADIISKLIPIYQQNRVFNAQLQLAKQRAQAEGAMIDPSQISVPGIPVAVSPDDQTKFLIAGGIGLLAVVLLLGKKRR